MTSLLIRRLAPLVAVGALTGCAAPPPPSPSPIGPPPSGWVAFDEGGLAFEHPAAWRVVRHEESSNFSHLVAELATVDVPAPCVTSQVSGGTMVSCADRFHLDPDTLVVKVEANGRSGFDILDHRPAEATPLTVGGLPAYVETFPPPPALGADLAMRWTISMPGMVDNYFTITALVRGPKLDRLKADVEAMVARLRYDPPVVPLPTGSAAAEAAAATALGALVQDSPAWACFPPRPGSREMLATSLPMGPTLARPQLATCTMQIEATPLELWRLTLTMRLPEPDPQAGRGETFVAWVHPDGTRGEMSGSPLQP
jgi:hypothetical protein